MKAFVGHSFSECDKDIIDRIKRFIGGFDIECVDGEKAKNKSIAEKVKSRIEECPIFIGIFTKDKPVYLGWNTIFKKTSYTTSNWVIQESGFAIGQDKEIILLVERGIHRFPELQGDMEVVYFDRNSLETPFQRLSEILNQIKDGKKDVTANKQSTEQEDPADAELKQINADQKEKLAEKTDESFKKYYKAVYEDESYEDAEKIFDQEIEPGVEASKKAEFKAMHLSSLHELGKSSAFNDLMDHLEENKDNYDVAWQVAIAYNKMREYKKAHEHYITAAQLIKSQNADMMEYYECYESAGLCLLFDGSYKDALALLDKLEKETEQRYKARLLKGLAKIAHRAKDQFTFQLYAEASLDLNPSDTDLRFDLAYSYSNDKSEAFKKLSLLHYKKLVNTTKTHSTAFNNLGVQYSNLGMEGKSIDSYKKAAQRNMTLAMSNLGNKYADSGFFEEAQDQIKTANNLAKEGIEVEGNIGILQNKLDEMLKDEKDLEEKFLNQGEVERKFRVKQSELFFSKKNFDDNLINQSWETKQWGPIELKADKSGHITGNSKIPLKKDDLHKDHYNKVMITGNIQGGVGSIDVKVVEVTVYRIISDAEYDRYSAKGLFYLSEEGDKLSVLFKEKNKIVKEQWTKKIPKKPKEQ